MAGEASPLWGFGVIFVWLVVLFAIGYLVYRSSGVGKKPGGVSDPALQELRLAYARGDISEEEFEERRSRLQREE